MQKYVVSLLHQITIKHTTMKTQILKNHGIETKIEGTFLFALDVVFNCNTNTSESKWVNVTNWSNKKLYNWLGY